MDHYLHYVCKYRQYAYMCLDNIFPGFSFDTGAFPRSLDVWGVAHEPGDWEPPLCDLHSFAWIFPLLHHFLMERFSIKLLRISQPSSLRGCTKLIFSLVFSYFILILLDLNPRGVFEALLLILPLSLLSAITGFSIPGFKFSLWSMQASPSPSSPLHSVHWGSQHLWCNPSLSEKKKSVSSSQAQAETLHWSWKFTNSFLFFSLFFLSYLFPWVLSASLLWLVCDNSNFSEVLPAVW